MPVYDQLTQAVELKRQQDVLNQLLGQSQELEKELEELQLTSLQNLGLNHMLVWHSGNSVHHINQVKLR